MYKVESKTKDGISSTEKKFKSFMTAKKYYDDFCRFLFGEIETEVDKETILAWSDGKHHRITFERLNQFSNR